MKRIKNNLLLATAFLLCCIQSVYAQEDQTQDVGLNKNGFYGAAGIVPFYLTATAYYERILGQKKVVTSFVKVGYGVYSSWGGGGRYVLAQYGILTGKKNNHFELGAGPNWFLKGDFEGRLPVTATMGYRFQKPAGDFIFRTGVSIPESVYIGVGISL
ncbi:MAG: hypothetical protein RIG68_07535 [Imperialibacter sp.]|uniref:hypothetical protein n=1 Tax=Imperialibacter sp. TaxID=2038411 RepID=UPI0032EEE6E4